MSEREQLYQLLDTVPDAKIAYIIGFVQNLAIENQEIPNKETLDAFKEVDEMRKNGTGEHFEGSTEDFFKMLLEE